MTVIAAESGGSRLHFEPVLRDIPIPTETNSVFAEGKNSRSDHEGTGFLSECSVCWGRSG